MKSRLHWLCAWHCTLKFPRPEGSWEDLRSRLEGPLLRRLSRQWVDQGTRMRSITPKKYKYTDFYICLIFFYYRTLFCIRLIAVVADLWVTPSFQLTVWLILWCFQLRLTDWSWLNEGCFAHWREFGWLVIMWQWLRTAFANLVDWL